MPLGGARPAELPDYHPLTVVRDWGGGQAFSLADALTGVCVFGATGSGKTSGPAKHLAYGYLANEFGGLVLCAKKEEVAQWVQWARDTDRSEDLVIVDRSGRARFNFLDWEAARSGAGGGLTINIVALLNEISQAVKGATAKESGGDSKFFDDALQHMATNLVDLVLFSGLQLSMPLMRDIVLSAPQTADEATSKGWKEKSVCAAVLEEAEEHMEGVDAGALADFAECRAYWTQEYPQLAFKTRSIVTLMFSMLTRPFTTRPLRTLFCADTNIKPEATFGGKIIIVDLPIQEFRLAGRVAALAWKYCFQMAVMRRPAAAPGKYLRPVFLWADEAQNFVTDQDAEYQAVARSAGGCTVYLTQNRESYRRVLGNDDTVDALLGNLQAKFFCQNSGDTNEWAAKLLGERYIEITGTNTGRTGQGDATSGVNVSEQRRYFVEPSTFTTLKRGGPKNGFQVEAIVYNGGHQFPVDSGGRPALLPYKKLIFKQN